MTGDDRKALTEVPGFRVGPDGAVDVLTAREVAAIIARVIREAIEAALTGCRERPIH